MPSTSASRGAKMKTTALKQDVTPGTDATYDLGSADYRWALAFVVACLVSTLTVGNVYLQMTDAGALSINSSLLINGTINSSSTINSTIIYADVNATSVQGDSLTVSDGTSTVKHSFVGGKYIIG